MYTLNYAETVPFHKIFKPGNQVKLRDFSHWYKNGSYKKRNYINILPSYKWS